VLSDAPQHLFLFGSSDFSRRDSGKGFGAMPIYTLESEH